MILHDYWRSTASYRVRIALGLKGLSYDQAPHDLRIGQHQSAGYANLNPQRLVPTLEVDGLALTQSVAIIEWLEECHPTPPLMPDDADGRAIVRAMAAVIASDIHPLNNMRVLNALRSEFDADAAQVSAWIGRWIGEGLQALEILVARHGGRFAFGDTPTLADCCLVPQLYSAARFEVPLDAYPRLRAAGAAALALPQIDGAHPDCQPDADQP